MQLGKAAKTRLLELRKKKEENCPTNAKSPRKRTGEKKDFRHRYNIGTGGVPNFLPGKKKKGRRREGAVCRISNYKSETELLLLGGKEIIDRLQLDHRKRKGKGLGLIIGRRKRKGKGDQDPSLCIHGTGEGEGWGLKDTQ